MLQEYDVVRLKKAVPIQHLAIGTRGTVLIVYTEPNLPRAYEVEFVDEIGNSIAVITVLDEDIEKIDD